MTSTADEDDDAPLGRFTERITEFMEFRDWECHGTFSGRDLCFDFPASFGGAQENMNFFTLSELFLNTLDCRFVCTPRGLRAKIITCGVQDGCPRHASWHFNYTPGPTRPFTPLLNDLETKAAQTNSADLVWCVLFGDCGRSASAAVAARKEREIDAT
ncbi:hypothetical protein ACPZ19_50540 [Amycolatopsis lurida]